MRAPDDGKRGWRWRRDGAFDAAYLQGSIRDYEPHRLHFLTETFTELLIATAVRPGDVVIDAGANHGYHTRHLLHAVGEAGHVHAFEPNPTLAAKLEGWTDARLTVHPVAVGASPGVATLHVPVDDDGWGSLVTDHMEPDRELITFEVNVERIDSFLCPGEAPTFVKLDVERSEDAALRGMDRFLGPSGPIVVFEAAADNTAAHTLQGSGYEVMDLLGRPLDEADHQLVNLLAVPKERAPEWHHWPSQAVIETVGARYREAFRNETSRPERLARQLRARWAARRT